MARPIIRSPWWLVCCFALACWDGRSEGQLTERERLQGTWTFVKSSGEGQKKRTRDVKMVFKDDTISFIGNDDKRTVRGTYEVDPTKNPKTLDIVIEKDSGATEITLAIYEMTGDNLKICHYLGAKAGKERPTQFLTDKQTVVGTLKRER
ncbi:MAG: TIGR03067 domain-containing protein [Verrucomicrobia subdivision 3 bacterium]|nr:TIGR03067 domain-containing protein [Limisphaerales bacterium]